MQRPALDPDWLARLRSRARLAPLRERVPLYVGSARVGTVEPDLLGPLRLSATHRVHAALHREEHLGALAWHLLGEPTTAMAMLAEGLRDAGLAGTWRHEQLGVNDAHGQRVGSIERAAVRPLGITTQAVHLVGRSPDGQIWVQQRAATKADDPGLWDTLVGGMVSSADTPRSALARETWEEAGLQLETLGGAVHRGRITVRRPSPQGRGCGYQHEHLDWFSATVPSGVEPANQDGEVAQFALLSEAQLAALLEQDRFTLEAALILASALSGD